MYCNIIPTEYKCIVHDLKFASTIIQNNNTQPEQPEKLVKGNSGCRFKEKVYKQPWLSVCNVLRFLDNHPLFIH